MKKQRAFIRTVLAGATALVVICGATRSDAETWLAIATGTRGGDNPVAGIGFASEGTEEAARAKALKDCQAFGVQCTAKSGKRGCAYVTKGERVTGKWKEVSVGGGNTTEAALANCEIHGFKCDKPIGGCVPADQSSPKPPAPAPVLTCKIVEGPTQQGDTCPEYGGVHVFYTWVQCSEPPQLFQYRDPRKNEWTTIAPGVNKTRIITCGAGVSQQDIRWR
jgi:hypothetical protein